MPRENRLCIICNMNVVENEYNCLLTCPLYRDIRVGYLPHYYSHWPTQNKFIQIMASSFCAVNQKLNMLSSLIHLLCVPQVQVLLLLIHRTDFAFSNRRQSLTGLVLVLIQFRYISNREDTQWKQRVLTLS
jgi:hypothetical protein